MTWLCRSCNSTTAWWESKCSSCGRAKSYADEPQRPQETEESESDSFSLADVVKQLFEKRPQPAPPINTPPYLTRDCACPPLYVCNNSACPRAVKVTLG